MYAVVYTADAVPHVVVTHTPHPNPFPLPPTPYTPHPTPYTRNLHPTPYTLHLTPYVVVPTRSLYINVQWFRGGLVFEAHRLLYHSA